MKRAMALWSLATFVLAPSLLSASEQVTISFKSGLLSVRCSEVPLELVFESIKAATGVELLLDDAIKKTRLSANIQDQPFNFAIERLLEGSGVNYAMILDPGDWQRVAKIFIGAGGRSVASSPAPAPARQPARRAPTRRPPPRPAQPPEEDFEEDGMDEAEAFGEAEEAPDPGATETPSSPTFVPPPPSFPRSRFTPGLASSPFQNRQGTRGATGTTPGNNPPDLYPFLDPFGRPISIPGTEPHGRQQQQQQQRERNPQS